MKPASKFDAIFEQKREREEPKTSNTINTSIEITPNKRPVGRPPGRGKSRNPDYTPVTVYLPRAVYDEAKIALIRAGKKEFSALMEELLLQWLRQKGNHE